MFETYSRVVAFTLLLFPSFEVYSDELVIYVTRPKYYIDWSTPRTLMASTMLNYATSDYARIGHLSVELKCSEHDWTGDSILTGMSTIKGNTLYDEAKGKNLGLSILYTNFSGQLNSSEEEFETIQKAKQDGRLKVIHIPTSSARCSQMYDFMYEWIIHGSYKVYGGGKKTEEGEGAGCTDFAMQFFKIATGTVVPEIWKAHVKIPENLINLPDSEFVSHLSSMSSMRKNSVLDAYRNLSNAEDSKLTSARTWALKGEYVDFEIPDPGYIFQWIEKEIDSERDEYFYIDHIVRMPTIFSTDFDFDSYVKEEAMKLPAVTRKKFTFTPALVSEEEKMETWEKIHFFSSPSESEN